MKQKGKAGLIAALVLFFLIAAAGVSYIAYATQYSDRFIEGTYINGMDVSHMTVDEVEEELRARVEDYSLTLTFLDGQEETLSMEDIGFAYQSDGKAAEIMKTQNALEWIRGVLGQGVEFEVSEAYTYDGEKLEAAFMALPEMQPENQRKPQDAHMAFGDDVRLMIVPEDNGTVIDASKVIPALKSAVTTGETAVDVTALGAYSKAAVTKTDPDLVTQVADLNTYLDVSVTYTMYDGSTVLIDKEAISTWLSVKEDDPDYYYMNTEVLKEKCTEFARSLAQQYDYTTDSVVFQSTNHGEKHYETEPAGYLIGEADEAAQLYEDILSREDVEREPIYSLYDEPKTTVGDTYIEVDIPYQHVYVYVDGQLYYDTPCVTGKATDPNRITHTGLYSIYYKQRNRTLQGNINPATGQPSYSSFVNYWMAFNDAEGLHDASWRSSFGGDIYRYSGSHGCVNLPYNAAKTIYGVCEVGTPVIVLGG